MDPGGIEDADAWAAQGITWEPINPGEPQQTPVVPSSSQPVQALEPWWQPVFRRASAYIISVVQTRIREVEHFQFNSFDDFLLQLQTNPYLQILTALIVIIVATVLTRAVMAPPSPLLSKLKVALKLSISRLRMVQQKQSAVAKINRRALAQIIEQGKLESAKIRVENIIREDINVELLEILELYCELLLARIGLMEMKEVDPGLEEAIQSIIYAALRTDVKELAQVRVILVEKYGKAYAQTAIDNTDGKVAERVSKKLRVEPPSPELVELYMQEIAKTYHVPYGPSASAVVEDDLLAPADDDNDDDQPGSGGLLEQPLAVAEEALSHATPPRKINLGPKSPIAIAPASPTTENVRPHVKLPDRTEPKPATLPSAPPQTPQKKAAAPASQRKPAATDVDQDLLRRFAALKQVPKD
ncbi:hypothetical protein ABW20_dc0107679 [Dactylellina cionopaga]|nr:hypothetical protein ABW20_dc0107679 [Dactylellina cionopaga]